MEKDEIIIMTIVSVVLIVAGVFFIFEPKMFLQLPSFAKLILIGLWAWIGTPCLIVIIGVFFGWIIEGNRSS